MTTFALVHGAWHGGWCWERLSPLLQAEGHSVVAVDLPCADAAYGAAGYAAVVLDALAAHGAGEDVVAVGHSLGGATIPLVAAARPLRRLVYLCAAVPQPGRSLVERPEGDAPPAAVRPGQMVQPDGTLIWTAEGARRAFYHDCPPAVAARAAARLRAQAMTPLWERCPLDRLPEVPATYVLCRDDRVTPADWSRRHVPDRLGVVPLELPGGHSPFLSRPAVLADLLLAQLTT
jgi:pimeloyl-ACP methyl ester carboxylesterase